MIFPGAGAHGTRQDQIKRDRDAARKADLAAMGMAAQQEIEVGTSSLPIHFRRVRDVRSVTYLTLEALLASLQNSMRLKIYFLGVALLFTSII